MSVWWVVWSFWAYINEPRDPKDMLYKIVELASSFSDLQKLTFFGCASRLRFEVLVKAEHDFYREKWQKRIEREKSHLTSL